MKTSHFVKVIVLSLLAFYFNFTFAQVIQEQQGQQGQQGQKSQQDTKVQDDQIIKLQSGTSFAITSVYSTNSKTAFATFGYGNIIKTSDEGKTWNKLNTETNRALQSIFFTDANTGFAVGDGGTIIKTTDAGKSWKAQTSGIMTDLKSVYFINATNGFAVGTSGTLVKTSNGGATWTKVTLETSEWLKDVYFFNSTTGYIVGWKGTILKTTDAGAKWEKQESPNDKILASVKFMNATNGFIAGWNGTMLSTEDAGKTWDETTVPINNDIADISFIDEVYGLAVGNGSTVMKTIDGGKTWDAERMNENSDYNAVCAFGDNAFLVVGSNGAITKVIIQEKLLAAELKKYWNSNKDAFAAYQLAKGEYSKKDYDKAIVHLDSAKKDLGKSNDIIQELRIKCYFENREFASAKKEIDTYYTMNPDTSSDFYTKAENFNKNIEKSIADEIDYKQALADSTDDALDKYISTHPTGIFKEDAMDAKIWSKIKGSDNPDQYADYLRQRPYGKYATLAQEMQIYYSAKKGNRAEPYEEYCNKFPKGTYYKEFSDTLKAMYLRMGEMGITMRNPNEAEKWFNKYAQKFSQSDTTNFIKTKMDELQNLRREVAEEQALKQKQDHINQLTNNLKWEKRRRNGKIIGTSIWGAITLGSAYGAYNAFSHDPAKLGSGILFSSLACIAIFPTISKASKIHRYQRNVRSIKNEIKQVNLSAIVNPTDDTFGFALQFHF
jgi:photosystem II stability/assembly factor-like uncharacterized protein